MSTYKIAFCLGCALLQVPYAAAQRESVKTSPGDSSETKIKPPSNTPGGDQYKAPRSAGPEKGGNKTAGAGTMDTTDTEGKAKPDKEDKKPKDGTKAERRRDGSGSEASPGEDAKTKTAYDFDLPSQDGKSIPLSGYKGKVLLIVNLGRMSSYNSQLAELEKLNHTYKDKGLVLIGVPSNDFGSAEPGTPPEIAKAYSDAKVDFLVTQPSPLTGVHQLALYGYLAKDKSIPNNGIHWNYTKFLVDRKGKVILRFGPDVAPDSLEMQATLQAVLDGTWKPKKEKPKREGGEESGDGPA